MAGSAFSAKNTCRAVPLIKAFFSCFAPTMTRNLVKSGQLPHFGILLKSVLFAPDSGEKTREKIKQGASDAVGKAKSKIAEGLEMLEDALEEK